MPSIKLTAKRQATLPAELCQELNLHPGDRLVLERRQIDGGPAWVMRPVVQGTSASWFGALRAFASGKSHDLGDIRRSIAVTTGRTTS